MGTRISRALLSLAAIGLGMAGCGNAVENVAEQIAEEIAEEGAGGDVDINVDGSEVTIESSEGTFKAGRELPDDWPDDVPGPMGCDIQTSQTMNTGQGFGGSVAYRCEAGDPESIYEELKGAAKQAGWTIDNENDIKSADLTNLSFFASKDDNRGIIVAVTLTNGSILGVSVTVQENLG